MTTGIGISPAVMINRIAHDSGVPQGGHLLEVAKLRADMAKAQLDERVTEAEPDKAVIQPANGAEVDKLV